MGRKKKEQPKEQSKEQPKEQVDKKEKPQPDNIFNSEFLKDDAKKVIEDDAKIIDNEEEKMENKSCPKCGKDLIHDTEQNKIYCIECDWEGEIESFQNEEKEEQPQKDNLDEYRTTINNVQDNIHKTFIQKYLESHPDATEEDAEFQFETIDPSDLDTDFPEIDEEVKNEADKIRKILNLFLKRGAMIERMQYDGDFINPLTFDIVNEIITGSFIKQISSIYEINTSELIETAQLHNVYKVQSLNQYEEENEQFMEEEPDGKIPPELDYNDFLN